jgi:hypothetical protein
MLSLYVEKLVLANRECTSYYEHILPGLVVILYRDGISASEVGEIVATQGITDALNNLRESLGYSFDVGNRMQGFQPSVRTSI